MITGFIKANIYKRRKRKQAKRLNLLSEKDISPQFFSPARVQAAKEEAETQWQQAIDNRKVQATLKKQKKEVEKLRRQ